MLLVIAIPFLVLPPLETMDENNAMDENEGDEHIAMHQDMDEASGGMSHLRENQHSSDVVAQMGLHWAI